MKMISIAIMATVVAAYSFANGGGADLNPVYSSGTLRLVPMPDVGVESESIEVAFEGEYAEVRASYSLLNSGAARTFDFAFAVDAVKDNFLWGEPWDGRSDVAREWSLALPRCSIRQGGTERKLSTKDEEYTTWLFGRDTTVVRRWIIASIDLARGMNDIAVEYRIQLSSAAYGPDTKGTHPHGLPMDRSDGVFVYDLAPSGSFGNGRAKRLSLTYDFSAARAAGYRVVDAFPMAAAPGADRVTAVWTDFDYASAPSLRVELDPLGCLLWSAPSTRKPIPVASVKASSSLGAAYAAEKAVDGDLATSWAEGAAGSGVGEWIEAGFPKGVGPSLILIGGGYMANAGLYEANNRITRVRVDFRYGSGKTETKEFDLAPVAYPVSTPFARFYEYMAAIPLRGQELSSLRITVLAVEAGSRYDDTCIAEVRFY